MWLTSLHERSCDATQLARDRMERRTMPTSSVDTSSRYVSLAFRPEGIRGARKGSCFGKPVVSLMALPGSLPTSLSVGFAARFATLLPANFRSR